MQTFEWFKQTNEWIYIYIYNIYKDKYNIQYTKHII